MDSIPPLEALSTRPPPGWNFEEEREKYRKARLKMVKKPPDEDAKEKRP
jgi:hypothetical protein